MSTRKHGDFNTNLSHPGKRRDFAQSAEKLGGFWRSSAHLDVDNRRVAVDHARIGIHVDCRLVFNDSVNDENFEHETRRVYDS
ncbi:hypothetical protein [uncultured Devosia sp.]|uniref:hypothetical protein n=1 Tax=uncultured Devosia sp. TaxID=211434 RepID=UPI0035CC4405